MATGSDVLVPYESCVPNVQSKTALSLDVMIQLAPPFNNCFQTKSRTDSGSHSKA
jgi:hypothetical protein